MMFDFKILTFDRGSAPKSWPEVEKELNAAGAHGYSIVETIKESPELLIFVMQRPHPA